MAGMMRRCTVSFMITYFLSDYGMEFVLVGFAVDDNGDWGPIWKSEPFTMTLEGASDPNEYVNR